MKQPPKGDVDITRSRSTQKAKYLTGARHIKVLYLRLLEGKEALEIGTNMSNMRHVGNPPCHRKQCWLPDLM